MRRLGVEGDSGSRGLPPPPSRGRGAALVVVAGVARVLADVVGSGEVRMLRAAAPTPSGLVAVEVVVRLALRCCGVGGEVG